MADNGKVFYGITYVNDDGEPELARVGGKAPNGESISMLACFDTVDAAVSFSMNHVKSSSAVIKLTVIPESLDAPADTTEDP